MAPTTECRVVRRHSAGSARRGPNFTGARRDSTILGWPLRRKGGSFRHFDTQHGLDLSVAQIGRLTCTDYSCLPRARAAIRSGGSKPLLPDLRVYFRQFLTDGPGTPMCKIDRARPGEIGLEQLL